MDFTPGARLGPYKILEALGSGAMGSVYLAYDERLGRRVALKTLTEAPGAGAKHRLHKEARAIARLNHPNIAGLYDVVEQENVAVLVMEYVDGEPLSALVRAGATAVDRALDIGLQLTEALVYAHREGVIHRDIKPANVVLTRDGQVKVLDLGIARLAVSDGDDSTVADAVTVIDATRGAGTPAYMAPERLRGRPADARTDVYSVGVLLFELLTGQRPFPSTDALSLAVALAGPTPHVRDTAPVVPKAVDELVARAMAADPAARFPTASDLRDALLAARGTGRVTPSPAASSTFLGRRTVIVAVGLLAIGAAIAWLMMRPAPIPPTLAVPPVVVASTDQPDLEELGALLQSVLARNLATRPGLTIVPFGATPAGGSSGSAVLPSATAGFTASLTIRHAVEGVAAEVTLWRRGSARPVWQDHYQADQAGLIRFATDGLATALEHAFLPDRALTDAERAAQRLVPHGNGRALGSYLTGRVLLDTSDNRTTDERAVAAFQESLSADPSFAFAQAGLSQAYTSLWKHVNESTWRDRATDSAKSALAIDPRADQAHLASALAFRAFEKKDDAVQEARKAVALTPDSDDAHRVLGLTLIDQGQADAGFAELRIAIALRPRHWMNQYALGRSLLVRHKNAEAVEFLQTVRDQLPNYESAYVNLGFGHLALGNWELAVGNLERAVQLNNADHFAFNNLATAYYWNHQFKEALGAYQEAIRQAPENPKQFMNLGDTYEALGQRDEARAAYARAVQFADAKRETRFDPETEAIAAKCEAKLGDPHAQARALAALAGDQKNAEVLYKLAVVFVLTQQIDKALDRLEQAVAQGYPIILVRDDPDMRALADQPRFKRVLQPPGR